MIVVVIFENQTKYHILATGFNLSDYWAEILDSISIYGMPNDLYSNLALPPHSFRAIQD